ncbi:MAG TPA: bifunctional glycoside hydrolase 114/ polysaccharide deacetylase family protein [Burkholderiales bacterium]|nr:bifunctional glycoside hydrolase 114/ polysaccharide deacetylase family protein [Burkholderiales bacterium]
MPRLKIGALLALTALLLASVAHGAPAVAFFYGASPPIDELSAFDAVVLEPGHSPAGPPPRPKTEWFAYVSVGEVNPARAWASELPAAWRLGTNAAFDSVIIDQAQPAWPEFFADRVVQPLWELGWRGLFLDTLDSYQALAKTAEARARQEAGMVALVRLLKVRFPGLKLFFNRGFEILPQVHGEAYAVAAESLYRAYDHGGQRYLEVSAADRDWLKARLAKVRDEYQLPSVVIDYVPAADRALARTTARRISTDGFIPWVATPSLDSLGVGAIEVLPRRVLILYEKISGADQLIEHDAHRLAAMPLNWLGYVPEYREVSQPLPEGELAGRYAGIVCWFTEQSDAAERAWPWLRRRIEGGMRVAILGAFGFRLERARADWLGLALGDWPRTSRSLVVTARDPLVGFEIAPVPERRTFQPITVARGTPLLSLGAPDGTRMDAAAFTEWGGYALAPYHVLTLPAALSKRWVIDPFAFLSRALDLPAMPVPDPTTESGRRLLLVHVDGDGFPSAAERPDAPVAGQVMRDELLARYRIPHTVSVIEGEIGKRGRYPERAAALESVARSIFALPHVEIASHSVSHPFRWQRPAPAPGQKDYTYTLDIPGYEYDPREEVRGSAEYIDKVLAPAGKRTRVFLWTGDCNPDELPLDEAARLGLLNMNGGDTLITRADPTLTSVAPLGIPRGAFFQVYAPNQNENVYTRLWRGRYYGYERAIETFELTEAPRRLKPVNIYYHTYSATKTASLTALHKVYRWALAQDLHPVYASEYVERVLDFNRAVIARTAEGWRVRGMRTLRNLRAPAALGVPDGDIAGALLHGNERFIHLLHGDADIRFAAEAAAGPRLQEANARVTAFERGEKALRFSLQGHVPIEFRLSGAAPCEVQLAGRRLRAEKDGRYRLAATDAKGIDVRCP